MKVVGTVVMPGRVLGRHVGGNTTYARALARGLAAQGVVVRCIPAGRSAVGSLWCETVAARRWRPGGEVLHYVADTGPLVRTRAPSVLTVHGVASRWIKVARNAAQEAVWRGRVRRAVAATDELVTVSRSSVADIVDVFGVDGARVHVIPHGVDHVLYRPDLVDGAALRRLGVPVGPYLLYVGNIEPRKNLVELVAAVRGRGLPRLVVAGRPAWNAAESMRAIVASDRVTYLGFVSECDKVALLRGCVALVFPSLYEGFGLPVVEALATGVPVICSDRGSLADVAGPAWRLADTGRDAIRQGVGEALGDGRWLAQVVGDGPAWAARFTWERSVDRHRKVYAQAAAARAGGSGGVPWS